MINIQSSKAQQGFGEVMERAMRGQDVVIERYGAPRVVVIDYARYQELVTSEREALRMRLQAAEAAVSARAANLSDEEVEALIEQARQEVHEGQHDAGGD